MEEELQWKKYNPENKEDNGGDDLACFVTTKFSTTTKLDPAHEQYDEGNYAHP